VGAFIYFRKNKKKAVLISLVIALAAFCIYFITTLVGSVYATAFDAGVVPFSKFSVAVYKGKAEDGGISQIENLADIDKYYQVGVSSMQISTVMGTTSSYVILTDQTGELKEILDRCGITSDVEVNDLRENDLILHQDLLTNKKKKIGDKLEELRITGVYKGDVKEAFGLVSEEDFFTIGGPQSYLIFPKEGRITDLNQELSDFDQGEWTIQSYDSALSNLDKDFSTINLILTIVVIMVSICIAIALAALVYTMYSHRYEEFAILNAMGYRKGQISKMIFVEIIMISTIATATGYALSLIALTLVNHFVYSGMGQTMQIFSIRNSLYTLILPLLVTVCALVSILQKLNGTDLISIIERR